MKTYEFLEFYQKVFHQKNLAKKAFCVFHCAVAWTKMILEWLHGCIFSQTYTQGKKCLCPAVKNGPGCDGMQQQTQWFYGIPCDRHCQRNQCIQNSIEQLHAYNSDAWVDWSQTCGRHINISVYPVLWPNETCLCKL